jgi:ribosomal-protein-alanine N-acetyltransferase
MSFLPLPASVAHAAVLAALHALAFPPPEQWRADDFAAQLAQPGVFGLMLPGAGIVLARVAADEAEILTIGVVPGARRAGCGAALLHAAEWRAVAAGAVKMFLEVAPDNQAACALYARAGYRAIGRRNRYYPDGSDALVLARPLTPAATTTL